jgi:hypothetical protein
MKIFLLDLWTDLREKRLWPVAVALLLGLVAVPVVLSKPADPAPPAPTAKAAPATAEPQDEEFAAVSLEESTTPKGSTLGTFDPTNPFKPPAKILKAGREAAEGPSSTSAGPSDDEPAAGTNSGSSSSAGSDTGGSDTGGSDTGGGTTTGGNGTGGQKPTTTQYTYVIDVTFRGGGRTRRIKSMQKLDMLPSEANPQLLFLGVAPDGGNAVFLVDATLDAAGEGKCKPSRKDCAFLYLGPGSEEEFTNEDGQSYMLRVDEIRKVKLEDAQASASVYRPSASAAVGAPDVAHRFVPPMIADLVTVSSNAGADSTANSDRR